MCGQTDVGACSLGQQDCVGGSFGLCQGAVDPVAEDCVNGLDDDCDGLTDLGDPECTGNSSSVVITQAGYDTPGDDTIEEFVDLFNASGAPIVLDGWWLADNNNSWPIPNGVTILVDGYVSIARNAAGFASLYGVTADASGMTLSLANGGDRLVLSDPLDEVDRVAWAEYDPGWSIVAPTGDSIERTDPTVDTHGVADWSVTSPATPRGGTLAPPTDCGNGFCESGEDCETCAADCDGVMSGNPSNRWCCGNA